MAIYNVHIYREMRLVFGSIEADSHEAAASIARDKPTDQADSIDDCDGETLAALVDVHGDEEYEQSRIIDFEPERQRKAATKLLAACRMVVDRWERGDLAEAARACSAAIEEAEKAECHRHGTRKDFKAEPSPLPPDPDGMNFDRASWAARAISAFRDATGTDGEDALSDLLADLMHWADRAGYGFDEAFDRARGHYGAETAGE